MSARTRLTCCFIVTCLFLCVPLTLRAELAVNPHNDQNLNGVPHVDTIILASITDDSDPIGVIWRPTRNISPDRILNAGGFARGDGLPDLSYDPTKRSPLVVWAYRVGVHHDIAFSEWLGTAWSPTVFLTAGDEDELDPRIFVETDGTAHVVWWTAGAFDRVFLASRPAGASAWNPPVQISAVGESGRRPSVAVFGGVLRVAYERDSPAVDMAQDLVVIGPDGVASPGSVVVASTASAERQDPVLHVEAGRLWLDWRHDADTFGWSAFGSSGWTEMRQLPWTDHTWVGIEETRARIRTRALGN